MIIATSKKFIGEQLQIPPIHSAAKRDGVRYYRMARRNEQFVPQPRLVEMTSLKLTEIKLPEIKFELTCSKGFYVRSFVRDFGAALNNGAHLTSLCRTRVGNFHLHDALDVNELADEIKKRRDEYYAEEKSFS